MILSFSCVFYTLFLFDTIADTDGVNKSVWVLIVVPLLPFVTYLMYILYEYTMRSGAIPADTNSGKGKTTADPQKLDYSIEMELTAAHRSPLHGSV